MIQTIANAPTIYNRRYTSVEAKQHKGPNLVVVSNWKGQQTASSGDYLITDPVALADLRKREADEGLSEGTLPNRGTVYVMPKAEFEAEFELADPAAGNEGAEASQGNQAGQGTQAAGETAKQETHEEVHA
jgi:hypothetical protein